MVRVGYACMQFLPKTTEDRRIGEDVVCCGCERESGSFETCSQEHIYGVVEMLSGLLVGWQVVAQVKGDD